jgi:hypothetical protein
VIALLLGLEIARTWGRSLPPVEIGARGGDPPTKDDGSGDGKAGEGKGGNARRGGKRANEKPPAVQPATLVTTIVDKDLFDPSRQKATEEVKAPPPKEAPPPPGLTVVGIRILGDRDSEAFITDASQANQQRRMRIGDEVGGYTVKSIQPSRVTLASATGDKITLNLAVDKSGTGTPGKPGAPPRPGQPGAPPRPGQPATANAASPAAGIQPTPPGAGIQPPRPGRPGMPARPAGPGAAPPAPGAPAPSPAAGNFGTPRAGVGVPPPPPAGTPPQNPNIPAAVRQKLEQLKGN